MHSRYIEQSSQYEVQPNEYIELNTQICWCRTRYTIYNNINKIADYAVSDSLMHSKDIEQTYQDKTYSGMLFF